MLCRPGRLGEPLLDFGSARTRETNLLGFTLGERNSVDQPVAVEGSDKTLDVVMRQVAISRGLEQDPNAREARAGRLGIPKGVEEATS
ncbi:MAG TPA: hypothetical protein VIQ02_20165 [Jiangellaceae bacterium]